MRGKINAQVSDVFEADSGAMVFPAYGLIQALWAGEQPG